MKYSKTKILLEQILKQDYLSANDTLKALILEAEDDREDDASETDEGGDDTSDETNDEGGDDIGDDASDETSDETSDEGSDDIDGDGTNDLGDDLGDQQDSIQDSTSDGQMNEMTSDVIEITCKVNKKLISNLYDKISTLKTKLNSANIDHDEREYVTLETSLAYYGNKIEELQTKTNPAIDQKKVEQKIDILTKAMKTLESQILALTGEEGEVPEVKTTDQLSSQEEGGEGQEDQEDNGEEQEEQQGEEEEAQEGTSNSELQDKSLDKGNSTEETQIEKQIKGK